MTVHCISLNHATLSQLLYTDTQGKSLLSTYLLKWLLVYEVGALETGTLTLRLQSGHDVLPKKEPAGFSKETI